MMDGRCGMEADTMSFEALWGAIPYPALVLDGADSAVLDMTRRRGAMAFRWRSTTSWWAGPISRRSFMTSMSRR